jgi:hypothetical protein
MKRFLATVCATLWVLPSALYAQGLGASQLILTNSSGGGVILRPNPAASSVITYTLPADLTAGTLVTDARILQSDASGNLSWLDPSALAAATAWTLTGNSITGSEFLGTTNNQPLVIRVNNAQTFQFNTNLSLQRDAGGYPRGQQAVDLQSERSATTQVASGNYSVIGGGAYNTASGGFATVGGGYSNDRQRRCCHRWRGLDQHRQQLLCHRWRGLTEHRRLYCHRWRGLSEHRQRLYCHRWRGRAKHRQRRLCHRWRGLF